MEQDGSESVFMCPVCGYAHLAQRPYAKMRSFPPGETLEPPYSTFLGEPSYEVCACCGFEFGNDDEPGTGHAGASFAEYRTRWMKDGAQWFNPALKPAGWDVHHQLRAARLLR